MNKVILTGRLGRDPEVRYSADGTAVCNMSLATDDSFVDRNTGQRVERADWHRVVAFRKQAEACKEYLVKGSLVLVEGRLKTRKWQDQEGKDHYATEVIADRVDFLDNRRASQQAAPASESPGVPQPDIPADAYGSDDIPF